MRSAIDAIMDQGSFLELQAGYAPNAIVGFARLAGRPVGVISQEPMMMAGVMDINSAIKSPAQCACAMPSTFQS
jgi:acetyl-CoA carboxylase carboxyltransferase component